jgi:WD40 repeat protein
MTAPSSPTAADDSRAGYRLVATLGDYVTSVGVTERGEVAAGSLAGDAVIVPDERAIDLPGHELGVLALEWSPDGTLLAVGGQDGVTRVCDVEGVGCGTVSGSGWVSAVAWHPHGRWLAAACGTTVLLIDAHTGRSTMCRPEPSTVTDLAWTPEGRRLGATSYGGVSWFEPDGPSPAEPVRRHEFKGSPLALALSPSGRWACAGFQDASIHIWRLWSGDELSMSGYDAKIRHLAFRSDGLWLAVACLDEITVWTFAGKGPKGTAPATGRAHDAPVNVLAWEPGGDDLLTGGDDGLLVLWPSPRKAKRPLEPRARIQRPAAVSTVAWVPGQRRAVVGWADGVVEVIDLDGLGLDG